MRSGKLMAKVVSVGRLDRGARDAMWAVFARYYAEVSRARFEVDLDGKNDVILLLDDGDGSVQGFSTLQVYEREIAGRPFLAVFSGDTIIDEAYWGQSALHRAFVRYVVAKKLARPFTEVYWFLISKGYKTYLLLSRNYATYWPRHDRQTPSRPRQIIDMLAADKYAYACNPASGCLEFDACEGRLKEGVAPIEVSLLEHEDIRFFVSKNPGHARGHELCCLGRVDGGLWLRFTSRLLAKVLGQSARALRRIWATQRA